ncbi:hypothetical protein F5Y10DRAFT_232005 [Nemania abortiva]|nr:hypothetical protein F5Y10DRAFT_232005 [Nemania abortiva]
MRRAAPLVSMNSHCFNPKDEDFFSGTLDSSNPFPETPDFTSSNSTQVEDAGSQFDHASNWWDEDLNLVDDFDSGGLQPNDLQPDDFQHMPHASHDGMFSKGYTGGHNIQAPHHPGLTTIPAMNNVRSRAVGPWGYPYRPVMGDTSLQQESERPMMYRDPSLYGYVDYMPETQHVPGFNASFRNDSNMVIPPVPFSSQFSSSDLCMQSQIPPADDIASLVESQASCNSRCTSSVCGNEDCSEDGTPCDDPACVENGATTGISVPPSHVSPLLVSGPPISSHQSHNQPCNHTESEHIVARTLGELRAEQDLRLKAPCLPDFSYSALVHEQGYDDSYHPYSASTPQPYTKVEDPGSNDLQIPPQPTPPLPNTPSRASDSGKHICQWVVNAGTPQGGSAICGAEFANTKDFHDHICEVHVDKLQRSMSGYTCSWAGCPRKGNEPFITRGKLRRHIATHSIYKPFTCSVCKENFSGLQALQQHERIHTGEKPFKCTMAGCTMAFKQKSALTMHLRTHTGEKPLICEHCGKHFPESSNLSKHRKTHMTKTDKYMCDENVKGKPCGRSFRRLDQLRRHRQTHFNPRRQRTSHDRSMSAISNIPGDTSGLEQLSGLLSGET